MPGTTTYVGTNPAALMSAQQYYRITFSNSWIGLASAFKSLYEGIVLTGMAVPLTPAPPESDAKAWVCDVRTTQGATGRPVSALVEALDDLSWTINPDRIEKVSGATATSAAAAQERYSQQTQYEKTLADQAPSLPTLPDIGRALREGGLLLLGLGVVAFLILRKAKE